jgi:pyruvate dehydrogenase E1 component beta subunit
LIFEHATLYPVEGESEDGTPMELCRAARRRRGKDVTLIAYGGALAKTERAAALLAEQGVDAEVIDLRSLRPLDSEMILASVARTHRAVIVEEAWRSGGFAAEVSARIMEGAFDALDAPVARVCGAEVPMPYAQAMEQAALPQPETIVKAVQGLM